MRSLSKSSTLSGPLLGGLLALLGSLAACSREYALCEPSGSGVATDVNNLCFDQGEPVPHHSSRRWRSPPMATPSS